jgi:hypothetical protein
MQVNEGLNYDAFSKYSNINTKDNKIMKRRDTMKMNKDNKKR